MDTNTSRILQKLDHKLEKARAWRDKARREFDANMRDTGIPHTCGALSIRASGLEYQRALEAAQKALNDHTNFIVSGAIPDDLDPDPEI